MNLDSIKRIYFVSAQRFTRSMATVMTPTMIQHQGESPMIEFLSDKDNTSPIREISQDVDNE